MVIHRINIRLDRADSQHTHCTLFMNGASCGKLIFRNEEYEVFVKCITLGAISFNQCAKADRVMTERTKL